MADSRISTIKDMKKKLTDMERDLKNLSIVVNNMEKQGLKLLDDNHLVIRRNVLSQGIVQLKTKINTMLRESDKKSNIYVTKATTDAKGPVSVGVQAESKTTSAARTASPVPVSDASGHDVVLVTPGAAASGTSRSNIPPAVTPVIRKPIPVAGSSAASVPAAVGDRKLEPVGTVIVHGSPPSGSIGSERDRKDTNKEVNTSSAVVKGSPRSLGAPQPPPVGAGQNNGSSLALSAASASVTSSNPQPDKVRAMVSAINLVLKQNFLSTTTLWHNNTSNNNQVIFTKYINDSKDSNDFKNSKNYFVVDISANDVKTLSSDVDTFVAMLVAFKQLHPDKLPALTTSEGDKKNWEKAFKKVENLYSQDDATKILSTISVPIAPVMAPISSTSQPALAATGRARKMSEGGDDKTPATANPGRSRSNSV